MGSWTGNVGDRLKGGMWLSEAVSFCVMRPSSATLGALPASSCILLWLLSVAVALAALPHHRVRRSHALSAGVLSLQGANGQPPYGGRGTFGTQGGHGAYVQGNSGGPGTPWDRGNYGGADGTNSQGGPWGQGGNGASHDSGTNVQVKQAAQP